MKFCHRLSHSIVGAAVRAAFVVIMGRLKSILWIERAMAKIRPPSSFLRLRLWISILAIASLVSIAYPLFLSTKTNVHIIPPRQFVTINGHQDIQNDYALWDSENELASLNETLLAYAVIDPTEKQQIHTIKMLLERGKGLPLNSRNRRNQRDWRNRGLGQNEILPTSVFQVQSPKYDLYWPRFRQLLRAWSRRKRLDRAVIGDLLGKIKKTIDDFYVMQGNSQGPLADGESERYKTCAVVGNSGILLSPRRFGSLIDDHEVVIRLNNANVKGFEDFVGSKTSVSFVNSNIYKACSLKQNCFCHPYGSIPIVLYLCQVQHLMDIASCEHYYDSPVVVTDPRFDALCNRLIKWYSLKDYVNVTGNAIQNWSQNHSAVEFHYSSGLQAVVLALGICEKVDIFGFGKALNRKHHYRDNQKAEFGLHDYEAEYLFYDDLAKNRTSSIPFFSGSGIRFPSFTIYK